MLHCQLRGQGRRWLLRTVGTDPEVTETGITTSMCLEGTDEAQRGPETTQPVSGKIVWAQSLLLLLLHSLKLMKPQKEQVC